MVHPKTNNFMVNQDLNTGQDRGKGEIEDDHTAPQFGGWLVQSGSSEDGG